MNRTISNNRFRLSVEMYVTRKYFSSDDFALCADQEGWELRLSKFGLASQMSGSYVDYVKYSDILHLLKFFLIFDFKKISNDIFYDI